MHTPQDDLTRHGGGDVLGARLPSNPADRPAAAEEFVQRAVQRWALGEHSSVIRESVAELLAAHECSEPLDICLRICARDLKLTIGSTTVVTATGLTVKPLATSAA